MRSHFPRRGGQFSNGFDNENSWLSKSPCVPVTFAVSDVASCEEEPTTSDGSCQLLLNPTSAPILASAELDRTPKPRPPYIRPLALQAQEELHYRGAGLLIFANIPGSGLCLLSSVERDRNNDVTYDDILMIAGGRRRGDFEHAGSLLTALGISNLEMFDMFSPSMRHALGGSIFGPGDATLAAVDAARFATMRSFALSRSDLCRASGASLSPGKTARTAVNPGVNAQLLYFGDSVNFPKWIPAPIKMVYRNPAAPRDTPGLCFSPDQWSTPYLHSSGTIDAIGRASERANHCAVWYGKGKYIFHAFHVQDPIGHAPLAEAKAEAKAEAETKTGADGRKASAATPPCSKSAGLKVDNPDNSVHDAGAKESPEEGNPEDPESSTPASTASTTPVPAPADFMAASATGKLSPSAIAAATAVLRDVQQIMTGVNPSGSPLDDIAVPTVTPRSVSAQETGPFAALRCAGPEGEKDARQHLPAQAADWVHSHGLSDEDAAALARKTLADVRARLPESCPPSAAIALALPELFNRLRKLAVARHKSGKVWKHGVSRLGTDDVSETVRLEWLPVASLLHGTKNCVPDFHFKTSEMYFSPPVPRVEDVELPARMQVSEENLARFFLDKEASLKARGFTMFAAVRPVAHIDCDAPLPATTSSPSTSVPWAAPISKDPMQVGSFIIDMLMDQHIRAWLTSEVKRVSPEWFVARTTRNV